MDRRTDADSVTDAEGLSPEERAEIAAVLHSRAEILDDLASRSGAVSFYQHKERADKLRRLAQKVAE